MKTVADRHRLAACRNKRCWRVFLGYHHRRTVGQPCVDGDRLSQWKMAKFDPSNSGNSWTDRHKIWNKWLCPQDDPLCKISCKSVHCGLLGKWVKYNQNFLVLYILFCWPTYRSDRLANFHARWLGRRGLTQGSKLFGNENSKLIFILWKIFSKVENWAQKRLKFSRINAPV